ncbi:MAG: ComF family protein [Desulfatitalea sp.]|nr:ComF family protein [Desulfatitalea sp.]NNK00954.1 ComF family protein [Desulfatitalea sp.]
MIPFQDTRSRLPVATGNIHTEKHPGRFRRLLRTGLAALFPAICHSCKRLYAMPDAMHQPIAAASPAEFFSAVMAPYLCARCRKGFTAVASPMCPQCGKPFVSPHGPDHLCGGCRTCAFRFQAARAAGIHEGVLRMVVHQLKFNSRDHLAPPLGRLLWHVLRRHWRPSDFDCIVPVPLHAGRLRQRGFNQALLLIRHWARWAAMDGIVLPPGWLGDDVLVRRRPTRPQTGLNKAERAVNLRDVFAVAKSSRIRSRRILLVDDVLTTGTTTNACASTLLHAGASEVRVLTLSRALLE